jgi:hypothetical protein
MTESSSAPIGETATHPSQRNAAVLRCCAARDLVLAEPRTRELEKYAASRLGAAAYMQAIPDLSGYENIRDFIACITHGLVTGDVSPIESSTFFYAAQVATGVLRREPKESEEPKAAARKAAAQKRPTPLPTGNHSNGKIPVTSAAIDSAQQFASCDGA